MNDQLATAPTAPEETMTSDDVPSVHKEIVVDAAIGRAFDVFTAGFSRWWPLATHHIGEVDAEIGVMEPFVGGRWYEKRVDGTECTWGQIVAWEPPTRLVLTWELDADFAAGGAAASTIEVAFAEAGEGRTRVTLEHRDLHAFAERAEEMRATFSSDGGWNGLLSLFAAAAAGPD
jgi:uncharacterized protein YndB with AHSA1/START domain